MDVAQAVDHIRPSIVQICSSEMGTLGTGFFVNSDGYVITAHHVIQGVGRIHVGLAQPNTENMRGNFSLVDCNVIDEDVRHDLALLNLRKNPFKGEVRSGFVVGGKEVPLLFGTVVLNPTRPKDGVAVGISGYPLGEPVLVTNAGWMATSWAFTIAQVPMPGAPQWFRMPDIADAYLADVEVNPGNSGAPVYLIENATVIGVCVGSKPAPIRDQNGNIDRRRLFYSSGLTMVVPVRYVIELLRNHNLGWSDLTKLSGRYMI